MPFERRQSQKVLNFPLIDFEPNYVDNLLAPIIDDGGSDNSDSPDEESKKDQSIQQEKPLPQSEIAAHKEEMEGFFKDSLPVKESIKR